MPVAPEGTLRNLEGSLTGWIRTHLVSGEGLTVQFPAMQDFTPPLQWVRVDYLFDLRGMFGQHVGPTALGERVWHLLNLNCCERVQERSSPYGLTVLLDRVVPYFQTGQTIPLRDYGSIGSPVCGALLVEGHTQAFVDDGQTSGIAVRNCSVSVSSVRTFTLVV